MTDEFESEDGLPNTTVADNVTAAAIDARMTGRPELSDKLFNARTQIDGGADPDTVLAGIEGHEVGGFRSKLEAAPTYAPVLDAWGSGETFADNYAHSNAFTNLIGAVFGDKALEAMTDPALLKASPRLARVLIDEGILPPIARGADAWRGEAPMKEPPRQPSTMPLGETDEAELQALYGKIGTAEYTLPKTQRRIRELEAKKGDEPISPGARYL